LSEIRVRFAPSPTGELHIGGARTALFNYLFSHRHRGTFILRIDDTDFERSKVEYVEKLLLAMKWLGLGWDEGPYYQSKRMIYYQSEASRLISEGKAYRCYCSIDELEAGRNAAKKENKAYHYPGTCRNLAPNEEERLIAKGEQPVIRLMTADQGETVVRDLIRGEVHFDNSGLDDFIIVKSSGQPTYNFASVIDDWKMKISHVIRAEEHLSNTPRQILCALALGYVLPAYAHVPMILAPDRSKLSKRHGATSVEEFRSLGFISEALINYMALLGWSPGAGDEESDIYNLDQMCDLFSLDKVNKTAAIYDTEKLTWMNGHYMRNYDLEQLTQFARPFFVKKGYISENATKSELEYLQKVIGVVRERAKTLVELADVAFYFFDDIFTYDQKGVEKAFKKEGIEDHLINIGKLLENVEVFDHHSTEAIFKKYSEQKGDSIGKTIQPVRLAITGLTGGPGLFEIMELLGRERTVKRIERAVTFVRSGLSQF
jgi:glutamyl-tRNA synthetase